MPSLPLKKLKSLVGPVALLLTTVFLCGIVTWLLIWPAYKNPSARMFTSRLGYASVLRSQGKPFEVDTTDVVRREIEGRFLGEGLVLSEPIQVPMIGMAKIVKIHVQEGDFVKKGQRLIELDDTRINLKIAAAEAALETAMAEFERIKVGSVNILLDERPQLNRIQIEAAQTAVKTEQAILNRYSKLRKKGSIGEQQWQQQKLKTKNAEVFLRKLELSTTFADEGRANSLRIGKATIREAEMALRHRQSQLEDYVSYAPADGIVERILVHEGEYNQDPGRPGIMLASGLWFEANLDQTAIGQVQVGNSVELRLSAFQDRSIPGTVERIKPLVNFSLGGPETNRPIRPLGTGSPEWPATFAVRIKFDELDKNLVPGLTGFARIYNRRTSLCVPRGTISATSGNRGVAFVVDEPTGDFAPRDVSIGWHDENWTEIRSGLLEGEQVIVDGYQVLEPGDRIACQHKNFDQDRTNVSSSIENLAGRQLHRPSMKPTSAQLGQSKIKRRDQ